MAPLAALRTAVLAVLAGAAAGCTSGPLSALDPGGPVSTSVARVWWVMFGGALLVLVAMMLIGVLVMVASPRTRSRVSTRQWLITGGLAVPGVTIALVLAYGLTAGPRMLPAPSAAAMRIDIEARQWTWDARYPDRRWTGVSAPPARAADALRGPASGLPAGAQTASVEQAADALPTQTIIHIPAGEPIDFHITSRDVIHSFWIPRLGGKMDAIPGRINVMRLQADAPGIYRGVCAEFCGVGHALMPFEVHAHDASEFTRSSGAER
ncbi:cytochrome c oxidase subunit II [Pigmentiphaga litoralis]|uniref:cytochrome c oxidase subunit II n=1 Tax=Pigmentiphaga litoralis TaxID=516702 RepID=UPI003B42BDA6